MDMQSCSLSLTSSLALNVSGRVQEGLAFQLSFLFYRPRP